MNLPPGYFRLEALPADTEKKRFGARELYNWLLILLLAIFSGVFNVLSEYGFDRLLYFFFAVLPLYYFIPASYRLVALNVLFLVFLVYALGPVSAIFYVCAALFLLFILRTIKPLWFYTLLFIFIAVLVLLRLEILFFPRLIIAVPYLAAAFMFRGIRMHYEAKHGFLKSGFWMDLAFFFIPANLCFLMFPVVDPVRFSTSYTGSSAMEQGLKRIFLGFSLVILYRLSVHLLALSYEDVNRFSALFRFAVLKYMIVINIAGILLAGVGTLGLCGFELPPVFGNLFLATSFSELWRKVNRYWREFMIRIFYFPVFMKLKRQPDWLRVWLAINITFFISWFMHEYQLFWISGELHYSTGLVYWMLFGNLVAFNVYRELKGGGKGQRTLFLRALSASLVFFICAMLWLLWTSETVSEYVYLVAFSVSSGFSWADLLLTVSFLYVAYLVLLYISDSMENKLERMERQLFRILLPILFGILMLAALSPAGDYLLVKKGMAVLSGVQITEEDNFMRDEGYYENVISAGQKKDWPWEIPLKGDKRFGSVGGATRRTGDLLLREFIPNSTTDMGYFTFRINSDGLRDKEYSLDKDAGTYRIAILGGSNECGYGVEKEQVFETLVEDSLNLKYTADGKKFEILNFAGLGTMLLQSMEATERKVLKYKPDMLIYFAHPEEARHVARNFSKLVLNGADLKYDFLKKIKREAGATQSMSRQELIARLMPYADSLISWGYGGIVKHCRENGITPVWAYVPTPKDQDPGMNLQRFSEMASAQGFLLIRMHDVYEGYDLTDIRVNDHDFHPNAAAHRLIADRLLEELLKRRGETGMLPYLKTTLPEL